MGGKGILRDWRSAGDVRRSIMHCLSARCVCLAKMQSTMALGLYNFYYGKAESPE
jgi:hypothetical protein